MPWQIACKQITRHLNTQMKSCLSSSHMHRCCQISHFMLTIIFTQRQSFRFFVILQVIKYEFFIHQIEDCGIWRFCKQYIENHEFPKLSAKFLMHSKRNEYVQDHPCNCVA